MTSITSLQHLQKLPVTSALMPLRKVVGQGLLFQRAISHITWKRPPFQQSAIRSPLFIQEKSFASKAQDLSQVVEDVKSSITKRTHYGLLKSLDDSIQAHAEERHFFELVDAAETINKLFIWRREFLGALNYEVTAIAKSLRTPCAYQLKKSETPAFENVQTLSEKFFQIAATQKPTAELLQNNCLLLEQVKKEFHKSFKREVKLDFRPVHLMLKNPPSCFPPKHQWEKREIRPQLEEKIGRYIKEHLAEENVKIFNEAHMIQMKLEGLLKHIQAL